MIRIKKKNRIKTKVINIIFELFNNLLLIKVDLDNLI